MLENYKKFITFVKEFEIELIDENLENLLGEINNESVFDYLEKNFSSMDHKFVVESLPIVRMILIEDLKYREIEYETGIPKATISRWFKKARETYFGYLDERLYSFLNPDLEWIGGNNPGLADFKNIEERIVISKKCRYDSRYRPNEKELSIEENNLIRNGWRGFLVLTDLLSKKIIRFRINLTTPQEEFL